jgi:hypothetical protein
MGAAAMAVDLGWLLWQSIEIQHGADAAALAGVIYEPDLRTEAHTEATAAAFANGYDDVLPGTTVSVIDSVDDNTAVAHSGQLRVTITHQVETFFLKIFGLDDVDIARTAVAEYTAPLLLGSPESYFGDDPAREIYPGYFAKIEGNYKPTKYGDRFGALCLDHGSGADCKSGGTSYGFNPEARMSSGWGTAAAQGGYVYGIEVAEGASGLKVEIFNGPLYSIRKSKTDPLPFTGDGNFFNDQSNWGPSTMVRATTWFMLYGPDPTPGDSTDGNELLCSISYDERLATYDIYEDNPPNSSAYAIDFGAMGWDDSWLEFDEVRAAGYQNILDAMWDDMAGSTIADSVSVGCSSGFDRGPGTYLLRVMPQHDDSGENAGGLWWRGSNFYTLRVSATTGTQPSVAAVGDMLIYSARNTTQTEFFLAQVLQGHAGRDLVIELFDVGDVTGGSGSFSILTGTGDIPDCDWIATDTITPSNPTSGSGTCTINASNQKFNNELITMVVPIPDDYACTGDGCWWKVRYDYSTGVPWDTTTWSAHIGGNPIRIVE